MATRAPSSTNRAAVAAPIPLAPPVMSTRLSRSPRISAAQRYQRPAKLLRTSMAPLPGTIRNHPIDAADGRFAHSVVLDSCFVHGEKLAVLDISCTPARRLTYAEYGELVEAVARGLV